MVFEPFLVDFLQVTVVCRKRVGSDREENCGVWYLRGFTGFEAAFSQNTWNIYVVFLIFFKKSGTHSSRCRKPCFLRVSTVFF